MNTAREIEMRVHDFEARMALPRFMMRRSFNKLAERAAFLMWDDSEPEYEPSVAVLRSVSHQHKRVMTQRIRWARWTDMTPIEFAG